jgi:hypothetical protein
MYGISVKKKIMAGKMAMIKLKATPLERSTISSSSILWKKILKNL